MAEPSDLAEEPEEEHEDAPLFRALTDADVLPPSSEDPAIYQDGDTC